MALPSSGMIDLDAIYTEVYGSAPTGQIDLVAIYNASFLPAKTDNINMEDFYGYSHTVIDPAATALQMAWQWKSIDSVAVDVHPNTMETTISITTSSPSGFFTTSIDGVTYNTSDKYATGDFTLYVKAAADNDSSPNTGSVTISDDAAVADDVVITVSQLAEPV